MSIQHEKLYKQKEQQVQTMHQEEQHQEQKQPMTEQLSKQEQQPLLGQLQIPQAVTLHMQDQSSVRREAQSGRSIARLLLGQDSFT